MDNMLIDGIDENFYNNIRNAILKARINISFFDKAQLNHNHFDFVAIDQMKKISSYSILRLFLVFLDTF